MTLFFYNTVVFWSDIIVACDENVTTLLTPYQPTTYNIARFSEVPWYYRGNYFHVVPSVVSNTAESEEYK